MTDEELLLWLRLEDTSLTDFAADRIEELIAERDQHWDSFVHWRKEADDRSEQLAAARRDAEEAEAYAEELEQQLGKAVKSAFEEGFLAAAADGWVNNPRIKMEWNRSQSRATRTTLAKLKGESHE